MAKNFKYWNRLIHRDLGYFFVGLIITFAISGIAMNHRESFDSREYTVKTEQVKLDLPKDKKELNEAYFKSISKSITPNEFRGMRERGDNVRLYFKNAFASININTGEGEIEYVKLIPVLGHMTTLHKSTNIWWIWFSDIFGIALLLIAISGMLIVKGKYSFKKRGWLLMSIGLIFPLIFLILN